MVELIKKLFSRVAIVMLALLIQIVLLAVIVERFADRYLYFAIPFMILSALFVLVVINRDMSASYKVPWIIVLLGIPVMGVVLYLVLGYPRLNRKQRKQAVRIAEETEPFRVQNGDVLANLEARDEEAAGHAKYFFNTSGMPIYDNTHTEYLPTGEEAFAVLKERLAKAEKFIFMEYFIVGEGKMWSELLEILEEKVKAGVEVKFMYDDFGCAGKIKHNFDETLRQKGIDCVKFGKLTPVLTAVHNNRDHRKITVIDGKEAFTGGFNLSDEYINETSPFGYWKDTGVHIVGDAVRSFTLMFLMQFSVQSGETVDYKKYIKESEPCLGEGYCLPFGDGPNPFYKDYIGEETYLNIINQAKRYVYITTPYLIIDYHILKALKTAAKRGVDVRIITPGVPDKKLVNIMTKSSYFGLIESGVKIYEFTPGFIHAKTFIADDSIGVVGTINLDYRSLVHHFECGLWMYKTTAVGEMKEDFDNTLYKCTFVEKEAARLKWYQRILASVIMIFAPLM